MKVKAKLPDDREQIEKRLFKALEVARERYKAGTYTRDEYAKVLHDFNDFVIRGILPAKQAAAGSN